MTGEARWGLGTLAPNWTAAFGSEINSLGVSAFALSSIVINNSTDLDLYADISFSVTGTTTTGTWPSLAFYLMPLNEDGTSYGDSTPTGSALPVQYAECAVPLQVGVSGGVMTGMARGIVLPPGAFCFGVGNLSGNALASTGNTISYRTYVENLNG